MKHKDQPLYRHPTHVELLNKGSLHFIWTLPDVHVDTYVGLPNPHKNHPFIVFVRDNSEHGWTWAGLNTLIDPTYTMGTGSQMTRAMTYHKAKDIVAVLNKYSKIEQACLAEFGERCPDFEPGCATCEGWLQFDRLIEAAKEKGKK